MLPADFSPSYIRLEPNGDALVVRFTRQRLTDDENIEQLGHELFTLVEQFGCRKLALSLAGVEYLTSAVLGKFITLHRKLHRQQGTLTIFDLGSEAGSILRASHLDEYFRVASDLPEALAQLQ